MSDRDAAVNMVQMADLVKPHAIRVAAALDLVDHIDSGADTAAELAARTGTLPAMLGRLLRYLAELGVLERLSGDGAEPRYRVAETGFPLRREHPCSVAEFLSVEGLFGRGELGLAGLLGSMRTGRTGYSCAFEREYWDDVNNAPEFLGALRDIGAQQIGWDAQVVIDSYDWTGVRHVTDVGGNNGTLLIALLNAFPELHGTVLDLPNLANLAEERVAAAGLADRCRVVAGSFFDPLPAGSDVYLLSGILADWVDDDAVRILGRCREAAGPTGRVLLAEINLDYPVSDLRSATFDISVTGTIPFPKRTRAEIDALVVRSGLEMTWRGPETAVRSVVELAPVGSDTAAPPAAPPAAAAVNA